VSVVESYERLNRLVIELAEAEGRRIAPILGRHGNFAEKGEPVYTETQGNRWLSIYQESGGLDPQWNGLIPAHLQIFADVQLCSPELLWKLRCAWFDLSVDLEQADSEVREMAKAHALNAQS
jgi:hypothetical protein